MRGSKAKAIRKAVYGDMSHKARMYEQNGRFGTIRNTANSLRAKYQRAKKA